MYRITIDREACDGIFACLVRDDRFVEDSADHSSGQRPREDSEGLAVLEVDDATAVTARFDDDRRESAEQAAAACPLDAITVESVDGETETATATEEAEP